MHNLHFVLINATSGKEACDSVENQIIDWGTENNWRTFCGAVSEDDEVYDGEDGRYRPQETEYTTIDKINLAVKEWINQTYYGETARQKFDKGETDLTSWNSVELWSLSEYAKHLSEGCRYKNKEFSILQADTFFEYEFSECGVTDLSYSNEKQEGEKLWVVFLDMHS